MKLKKVLLLTIALQFSSFVLASNLQEQLINATNSLAVAQQTLVNLLPSPPANPNGSDGTPGENSQITYSAPLLSKVIADKII